MLLLSLLPVPPSYSHELILNILPTLTQLWKATDVCAMAYCQHRGCFKHRYKTAPKSVFPVIPVLVPLLLYFLKRNPGFLFSFPSTLIGHDSPSGVLILHPAQVSATEASHLLSLLPSCPSHLLHIFRTARQPQWLPTASDPWTTWAFRTVRGLTWSGSLPTPWLTSRSRLQLSLPFHWTALQRFTSYSLSFTHSWQTTHQSLHRAL